jgi:hypothetical protein
MTSSLLPTTGERSCQRQLFQLIDNWNQNQSLTSASRQVFTGTYSAEDSPQVFTGTYSAEDAPVVRMNGSELLLLLHVEAGDSEEQGEQPRVHACTKSITIWTLGMF